MTFKEGVDYDLCLTIIRYCAGSHIPGFQSAQNGRQSLPNSGAILVFLPGFEDITIMRDKIKSTCTEDDWNGFQPVVLMLHSQMNTFEQHSVFEKFYHNQRKIVSYSINQNTFKTYIALTEKRTCASYQILKAFFYFRNFLYQNIPKLTKRVRKELVLIS